MKIKVVSRKLIKPHKPTPQNLNQLNLSFLDENAAATNVGVALLYPNHPISSPEPRRCHLQESLSKTLTQFYPLAGRYIKKDHYVDCADQGVEWVEAEAAEAELTDAVAKTEADQLKDLLPRQLNQVDLESPTDPLVSIQITVFKCGGLGIGISIWHGICDGPSMGTFIKAWSNAANNPTESSSSICPSFDLAALFPRNCSYMAELGQIIAAANNHRPSNDSNIVAKRFRFNKEAIESVRSRYDLVRASRVRVVCAVITKALMGVERRKHGPGKARPSMGAQMFNMRGRTVPPAPEHSCGNLITVSLTSYIETEETDIRQLVHLFNDGLQRTISDCAKMFSADTDRYVMAITPMKNLIERFLTGDTNIVIFTDWSKLGSYEADFGWGKPVGTGVLPLPHENSTILMESEESGGLEAWVHLTPSNMTYFEQDQEIHKLLFTTSN